MIAFLFIRDESRSTLFSMRKKEKKEQTIGRFEISLYCRVLVTRSFCGIRKRNSGRDIIKTPMLKEFTGEIEDVEHLLRGCVS